MSSQQRSRGLRITSRGMCGEGPIVRGRDEDGEPFQIIGEAAERIAWIITASVSVAKDGKQR